MERSLTFAQKTILAAKDLHLLDYYCDDGTFDEEGSMDFYEKIAPRIFKGLKGSYEKTPVNKIVEHQRCGETWFLTWKELEGLDATGDPFVLLITVPKSDVTAAPDKIEADIRTTIQASAITSLIVLVLVAVISTSLSVLFARAVSLPLRTLAEYLSTIEHCDFAVDVPAFDHRSCSCEQLDMFEHLESLLIALRFGTPAWADGDRQKELNNYGLALKLVTGARGKGVCKTMIGSTARRMEAERKLGRLKRRQRRGRSAPGETTQLLPLQIHSESLITSMDGKAVLANEELADALQIAKNASAAGHKSNVVAGRALNKALWHIDQVVYRQDGVSIEDMCLEVRAYARNSSPFTHVHV